MEKLNHFGRFSLNMEIIALLMLFYITNSTLSVKNSLFRFGNILKEGGCPKFIHPEIAVAIWAHVSFLRELGLLKLF